MFGEEPTENLIDSWRGAFTSRVFVYEDPKQSFRAVVADQFSNLDDRLYGIYIIRRCDTNEILYIGKGGTVANDGTYKGQTLPSRLRNVRDTDVPADRWFRELLAHAGPLSIECIVLRPPIAPAYVEAQILQAYLSDHRRLPMSNRVF